ncbi:MAG: FGGY family carbohydrate kinase [Spirochaetia bacterium]|jgi:xylulokinase
MAESLFIGVDVGTQGVKAAMYDRGGRLRGEAFRKSDLKRPSAGVVEEDPEFQLSSVCQTVAECAACAPSGASVKGIAIDGQMAGIIGVGEGGKNVTPYDSWLDTRCAPWITYLQKEAGAEIVRKSGGPPSFNHGPKILWWKNEHPDVFRRIRAFVQPGGYAAMRLTGRDGSGAFIDRSYLHFSGFADSRAAAWDKALCSRFGVDVAALPRIVASHEVMGGLTEGMAKLCGLPAGVPVVAGCGDTAASFLSCGATRPGICVDVAGTASVFACSVTDFKVDEKDMVLSCGRSAVQGLWHPYAYINGGGMNLEWFRDQLGCGGDFDSLNAAAAAVQPSADDPIFVPHLGGRVSPGQPLLRGAWVGLSWSHGMGHLYRAVLEGVALEYGIYLGCLESLYGKGKVTEVRVTGGGEKSAVWNKIKADVLGVPIVQIPGAGGAPLGSALLAAYGVGEVKDLDATAAEWVRTGAVTEPDPSRAALGRSRVERYTRLLETMNAWSEERK